MTEHDGTDVLERFRGEPDRMVRTDAGEVAVRSFGTGPAVLFVHGWPVSGATFRDLVARLRDVATCHVLDLPGAGSGRAHPGVPVTVDGHVRAVRQVVDALDLQDVAVVGHDSGGLIARHALAGDPRVRAWGLIDTEQLRGLSPLFRAFLLGRRLPGFSAGLRLALRSRRLRRGPLVLGGAFSDRSLLDGPFDELFLRPIVDDADRRRRAVELLDSFDVRLVRELDDVHRRMTAPTVLVWGRDDPFFPVAWAEEMVHTLPDARLHVVEGARLFSHEERPAEVAAALREVLV